jgi:hypothetical protein
MLPPVFNAVFYYIMVIRAVPGSASVVPEEDCSQNNACQKSEDENSSDNGGKAYFLSDSGQHAFSFSHTFSSQINICFLI